MPAPPNIVFVFSDQHRARTTGTTAPPSPRWTSNSGRVAAAIDAAGLRDDTIIVYTSDHGAMLGSHGMTRKQHPWDESIGVPLLLRCPEQAGRGRHLSFPFGVVDIR